MHIFYIVVISCWSYLNARAHSKSLAQWQHELRKAQRHLTPLQLPFRQPLAPQQLRSHAAGHAGGGRKQGWELRVVKDLALQLPWIWEIIGQSTDARVGILLGLWTAWWDDPASNVGSFGANEGFHHQHWWYVWRMSGPGEWKNMEKQIGEGWE